MFVCGGTLHVTRRSLLTSSYKLVETMHGEQVGSMNKTTSVMKYLAPSFSWWTGVFLF